MAVITGTNQADQIRGGNGNDQISGDAGNDRLSGDNGNDILDGGADNDVLDGGRGDDVMTGGPGADTFVQSQGNDRITDFSPAVTTTTQVLIDFEGIAPQEGTAPIPNGYKGLDWANAYAIHDDRFLGGQSGNNNVLNSGEAVGYKGRDTDPAASFSSAQDFDLESGYFAAFYHYGLTLTIQAWDDGVRVGTATIVLDVDKVPVNFQLRTAEGADSADFDGHFTSIDRVVIDSAGGLNASFDYAGGTQVAMEDLLLSVQGTSGDGDMIDVPAGTNVAALVASAQSDGSGGTVLNGRLTLEDTNPSDVSASWFV